MPKTSVHENRDTLFVKYEIWLTDQWVVTPPPCDFQCTQNLNQPHFCGMVALAADKRHSPGTFFNTEAVHSNFRPPMSQDRVVCYARGAIPENVLVHSVTEP